MSRRRRSPWEGRRRTSATRSCYPSHRRPSEADARIPEYLAFAVRGIRRSHEWSPSGLDSDNLYHGGQFHQVVRRARTNILFAVVTIVALLSSVVVLWTYIASTPSDSVLRLGYFPNVTHAQALYGIPTGFFQSVLQPDVTLEPMAFNAGSTAIASLLANRVDVIFVGPSPTLHALAASGPDYIRVIA